MKLAPNWRSASAMTAMLLAVAITYFPLRPSDIPANRETTLRGYDYLGLRARRLRYAQDALFGPNHNLPGWYAREFGGTPFRANIQNLPFIPTRLPLLLIDPERACVFGVMIAALQTGLPRNAYYEHLTADEFVANVSTPRPAYLRLLESWDDGWRATVDARPVELIAAYDVFMAIPIPAGKHSVRLTYYTPGATSGLVLSAVSLILLCRLCGWASQQQAGQSLTTAPIRDNSG